MNNFVLINSICINIFNEVNEKNEIIFLKIMVFFNLISSINKYEKKNFKKILFCAIKG